MALLLSLPPPPPPPSPPPPSSSTTTTTSTVVDSSMQQFYAELNAEETEFSSHIASEIEKPSTIHHRHHKDKKTVRTRINWRILVEFFFTFLETTEKFTNGTDSKMDSCSSRIAWFWRNEWIIKNWSITLKNDSFHLYIEKHRHLQNSADVLILCEHWDSR